MTEKNNHFPMAYACYNKNEEIRMESTSGGIFSLLGEYVIQKRNGVVCGAIFDENFIVSHIVVDNIAELGKMRGSKYPQSNIGNCYRKIKSYLQQNITVLFTGTPCQIEGLLSYLGKKDENLILMDFICHGVASPGIWNRYLEECKNIKHIVSIRFKDKIKGWKNWYIKIQYQNHTWYQRGRMNEFMKSYLQYANIRPSCYYCHFKGLKRNSDFTISDCWGIGEENTRLNDNSGLSALLIQNKKALDIFNELNSQMEFELYDPIKLMEKNWTTFKSVPIHPFREKFFQLNISRGTQYAMAKMFRPKISDWIYYYYLKLRGKEK